MSPETSKLLLDATKQNTLASAIRYLAEGHFIEPGVDRVSLLRALCSTTSDGPHVVDATRRLAREVTESELNTAAVLMGPELITPPSTYRGALDQLADRTTKKTLVHGVSVAQVLSAQRANAHVVATLAAVAGLSWNELSQRAGITSPGTQSGQWTSEAVGKVLAVINAIVDDQVPVPLAGGFAARPIELLADPVVTAKGQTGWAAIERFRTAGVPYEVLLAQRTEGGAWRTHRDRTGAQFTRLLANELVTLLDTAGMAHRRTKNAGGDLTRAQTDAVVGGGGDQISLVLLDQQGAAVGAVVISIANDGGSASKSVARLAKLADKVTVPVWAVVAGLGWSQRNETAELATALSGRLYTDKNLPQLVDHLAQ